MAADPLLPEVCWSWLTGALEARGLTYGEPSGTVTRAGSHYFGGLAERPAADADRDPRVLDAAARVPARVPDTAAHLAAWCDLLCQSRGCRRQADGRRRRCVVSLPQRRGPQHR